MAASGNSSTPTEEKVIVAMEQVSLDLQLLDSILKLGRYSSAESNVLRVPNWLRNSEKTTIIKHLYEPSLSSLGPYHHGKPHLQEMEQKKWLPVRELYSKPLVLTDCLKNLKESEGRARTYYDEKEVKNLSSNEFLMMMMVDGCFIIIALIFTFCEKQYIGGTDVIPGITIQVSEDLLLIENQIPFFILQKNFLFAEKEIYEILELPVHDDLGNDASHWNFINKKLKNGENVEKFDNLLHLYYHCFVDEDQCEKQVGEYSSGILSFFGYLSCWFPKKSGEQKRGRKRRVGSRPPHVIHSATKLQERGVVFEKKDAAIFLQNITLTKKGVLKIPCFSLDDTKMMNMMAFEQCKHKKIAVGEWEDDNDDKEGKVRIDTSISNMIHFIASMITNSRDLDLLEDCGIIERGTRSSNEDALHFFTLLRGNLQLNIDESYILDICYDLNLFICSRRNQWWAKLKKDYFSNPWSLISLIAAIFLLILTCLQTFFTIYAYYIPRS